MDTVNDEKEEYQLNPYLLTHPRYHGKGGYLTVQEAPWRTPLVLAFVAAGEELGYENRDINGEYQTGFMVAQVCQTGPDHRIKIEDVYNNL